MEQTSGKRVLIVEDEAIIARSLAHYLEKYGHHAAVCEDGEQAVKALAGSTFEVVITDLNLPGISGREVIRQALQADDHCMIICISAELSDEVNIADKAGRICCVQKPFALRDILGFVDQY